MLEPTNRRLLLESLRPPEGYRLDYALGTTYSLDLMAVLSAPVAFAFAEFQDREGRAIVEPLALLKAVRQYADRVCLFHQAGKIHVPGQYQPLLASLEGSIVAANAPRGGRFHPKVWALRFSDEEDGSVSYRFLCASRNMTFDRSWDTLLCLEGELRDRVNAFARNHPLGEFIEALPSMADGSLAPLWRNRIDEMAYELRRVEFEVPEPFEEIGFFPVGIAEEQRWPFPGRMDNLLVVSPFVGDSLLSDLADWEAPMQLVSRPECLARLKPETLDLFKHVWVLDDTAEPEPGDTEEESTAATASESADAVDTTHPPTDMPLVGLHAKLYVTDIGREGHVWTGSSNATRAGFEDNVEFLVQLSGKKKVCGVEALLGRPAEEGKKRVACLMDLLQPFSHPGEPADGDVAAEQFEREVDAFAKSLAAAEPVAACEALDEPESFALAIRPTKAVAPKFAGTLRIRPISLKPFDFRDADLAADEWARFEPVSLLGLTSFFAFESTSPDGKHVRQFVLNIPLQNAPEQRHQHILRHLLSDRDRVLRFLLLLLSDSDAGDFARFFGEGNGEGKPSFVHSMFGATLFESLIRALDRDPERIDQAADVIDDLRRSADGLDLLPENLDSIWEPIREVRRRQLEREQRAPRRRN